MLPNVSRLLATIFLSRTFSAAILVIYVVTAAGVPLPSGGGTHSTELYPCANCPCGCASAEQCWRSCCCHSLAERFDWAREHKVRPPEFAIAAAQSAGIDLCWLEIQAPAHDGPKPACRSRTVASTLPMCCQKRLESCCDHSTHACCQKGQDQHKNSSQGGRVVAWRALACQGQSMNWLAAVPTLVVEPPSVSHDLPPVGWLSATLSDAVTCVMSPPDVPPPECA
jgi:hypothetical protein